MHGSQQRRGAALIVAMIFVIFIVVMATYFISTMGNYRGAGSQKVRYLLADAALEAGRAHAVLVLQEHALESDRTLLDNPSPTATAVDRQRDLYTGFASSWRTVFQADISLEPGGVKPNGSPPVENVPDQGLTYDGLDSSVYDDQLTLPMLQVFDKTYGGYGEATDRILTTRHGARYFNVGWFDEGFAPMPDSERDRARYKLRYAVQVFDVGGLVKTNFYPETSFETQDLDRDIPVSDYGLRSGVVAEPWGVGNAGDLRREYDMLRDRYGAALMSMENVPRYAGRTYYGWKDPADVAFDRWLRWEPHVTIGSDAFISKPGLEGHHFYAPRPARWRDIDDVVPDNQGYNKTMAKHIGLRHYYAADESGIMPVDGNLSGHTAPRRYINPGPIGSFEIHRVLLNTGANGLQNDIKFARYTPIGEGLSRRRGDDVDTQLYYNILTLHDSEVFALTHSWSSWLQATNMTTIGTGDVTVENHLQAATQPYDLLPPADGVPLDKDDNFGISNADVGYVDGDPLYEKNHDDSGSGYFPYRDVIREGDANGDGDLELYVDADPEAPGYRPRFVADAWYERSHDLRRHFYGLAGTEGKGISPRMRDAGSRMADYSQHTGSLSPDARTGTITSPDYPYYGGAAMKNQDLEQILVQDHYAWDIADALNQTLTITRLAWSASGSDVQSLQRIATWAERAKVRHQLRDIHAVHRLFLNMLGEDVSTVAPFAGPERPETWLAQPGVLAGRALTRFTSDPAARGDNHWLVAEFDFRTEKRIEAIGDHPRQVRLAHGVNSAGMERLLNDVRIAFFGASYVDSAGVTQPIPPLDFNGDGFAESSLAGFNDGLIEPPAGYVHGTSRPRPYWTEPTDPANPYHPFLAKAPHMPSKPFTAIGRLFMGKSHYYRVLVRGQLWDLARDEKSAERNVEFIYCVNPSDHAATIQLEGPEVGGSADLSDSHIVFQRMLVNMNRDGQGGN